MAYILDRFGHYLSDLTRTARRAREAARYGATEGSPARCEQAAAAAPVAEWLEDVQAIVAAMLTAAEDNLAGLGKLIADPNISYATFPVARSCAEISAQTWWLTDPTIDPAERVGRWMHARLESLREQGRLGFGEAKDTADRKAAELKQRIAQAHVHVVTAPSATKLVARVLADDDSTEVTSWPGYKLLSAFTHGTLYALGFMLEPVVDEHGEHVRTGERTFMAQWRTDALLDGQAAYVALRAYSRAAMSWMEWTGNVDDGWKSMIAYATSELRQRILATDRARGRC